MTMNEHLHIHKNTGFQTASQPKQSQFQSRPFVVQPQTEEQSSQPDLKTALQRAERYGHRLDRIKFSEAPAPAQVRRIVQAKLTIGEPGDRYEQEADRVAAQVVDSIHAPSSHRSELNQAVQRQEEPEEEIQAKPNVSDLMRSPLPSEVQREAMPEDEELQTKSILQRREAIGGGEASTDVESAINSAKGGGQPLEAGLQRSMGQAMGADFSKVKIHTDAQADQLNQSIQARAFTTGQDVFFRSGEYNPGSRGGQELIAHELTHVVQQNGGALQKTPKGSVIQEEGQIVQKAEAEREVTKYKKVTEGSKDVWKTHLKLIESTDPSVYVHISRSTTTDPSTMSVTKGIPGAKYPVKGEMERENTATNENPILPRQQYTRVNNVHITLEGRYGAVMEELASVGENKEGLEGIKKNPGYGRYVNLNYGDITGRKKITEDTIQEKLKKEANKTVKRLNATPDLSKEVKKYAYETATNVFQATTNFTNRLINTTPALSQMQQNTTLGHYSGEDWQREG